MSQLEEYYDVEYQPFIETYSGGSASLVVNGESQNASLMTYAPNGQVEAPFVAVSNLGCNAVSLVIPTELLRYRIVPLTMLTM